MIGALQNEADLTRFVENVMLEKFGIVRFNRIAGTLGGSQLPIPLPFGEVDTDPDNPPSGMLLYCIADDGAGKRALRALFPTGTFVTLGTEP